MFKFFRDRLFLLVIILTLLFVLLVAAVVYQVTDTQRALRVQTYDTEGIAGVQAMLHYENMMSKMLAYQISGRSEDAKEAATKFDVLFSRLKFMPQRPPYNEFLDQETNNLIDKTFKKLEQTAPLIDAATNGSPSIISTVYRQLRPLQQDISRIASRTQQLAAEYQSAKRKAAVARSNRIAVLIIGLIFVGTAFGAIILHQLRRTGERNAELERLTLKLRDAIDEAACANRAKSDFLSHMSHELRTPLNAIIGFSEVMRNEVLGKHQVDNYRTCSEDIHKSGTFLLSIINDLLDLARIEAGNTTLEPEVLSSADLIADCLSFLDQKISDKGIRVTSNFSPPTPQCYADPVRICQVIINILTNAVKFAPDNGEIDINVSKAANNMVLISIKNNGPFISADELVRIFEPFQQAKNVMRRTHDGLGLGLSISKSLVELHGGKISITSGQESGTRVDIFIPAA